MWLHIILFVMIVIVALGWKFQWFGVEKKKNQQGRRLFVMVALCGNILGAVLTFQSGGNKIYSNGHSMKKEEGPYEEKFLVSVDGSKPETIYVQIPQKETQQNTEMETEEKISPEAAYLNELQETIMQYNQKKADEDYYYLPGEWKGKHLEWEQPGNHSGAVFSALFLVAAIAVFILKGREEFTLEQKRREQMLMDYPGVIMKFTLLVQAGMTARKAFEKMAVDYKRRKMDKKKYVYEEILVICYELDSGVSESEAYRHFGERCGQVKYKTFATLLIQNLQKGSRHLEDMLERESIEAWEERKRKARVLGEAAATKLLGPMVLMLLVVMAVIMIPACLTFYGG